MYTEEIKYLDDAIKGEDRDKPLTFTRLEVLILLKDYKDAQQQVKNTVALADISKSVFIVCENDDHGRDLYLDVKDTREEAEEIKGRDNTRNVYEHEVS